MDAVNGNDLGYLVEAISDSTGAIITYRYTVYQLAPKQQKLLYGFKQTQEEAERTAAAYTQIASEGCERYLVS